VIKQDKKINNRAKWSSQIAFVLALTGAAVGLGNIWKFPYMAGDNGGSAFVLIYILAVVIIGLPVMIGEIVVGRAARANPVNALESLAKKEGKTKNWGLLGWWGMLGLLITLSFYCVIAGWSVFYLIKACTGSLSDLHSYQLIAVWQNFLASPGTMTLYTLIFIVITMFVVGRGVHRGLEIANVYMMPILFLILIFLVFYAHIVAGPNFNRAVHFLFDFHADKVTGGVIINALGHAFFTLAVGVGAMEIYGSYIGDKTSIGQSVLATAILDVLTAFLSGLAIFPILFMNHIAPHEGPGLMFLALPMAFSNMYGGQFLAILFFLLLLFAAWTSSINIAEPIVAMLHERTKMSRVKASWILGIVCAVLSLISVFSFNIWKHVRLFGHFDLFTAITDLSTNIFLPVGGIFYAIFAGWVMKRSLTKSQLRFKSDALYSSWRFLTRYVAPIGILIVFISAFF
jgi:NSS family neurotransmitter:Na+ symporter